MNGCFMLFVSTCGPYYFSSLSYFSCWRREIPLIRVSLLDRGHTVLVTAAAANQLDMDTTLLSYFSSVGADRMLLLGRFGFTGALEQ